VSLARSSHLWDRRPRSDQTFCRLCGLILSAPYAAELRSDCYGFFLDDELFALAIPGMPRGHQSGIVTRVDASFRSVLGIWVRVCVLGIPMTPSNYLTSLVLPVGIEPTTSPLPRECSTTELRQHSGSEVGPWYGRKAIHEIPAAVQVRQKIIV
jgi:hypothetical protein